VQDRRSVAWKRQVLGGIGHDWGLWDAI
jgi:hypothetical protein